MKIFINLITFLTFISNAFLCLAATEDSIRIGVVMGLTGMEAHSQTVEYRGIEMATDKINASGGIKGREVKLIKYDTRQTIPDTVTAMNKALNDKLAAIIGDVQSIYALIEADIAQKNNTFLLIPHATHVNITKNKRYVFRACFNDDVQGTALAYFATKVLGAKKIAVFTNASNDYSIGLSDTFMSKAIVFGAAIVAQEKYLTEQSDFKAQIKDAISKKPQVFFIPGYNFDSTLIIQQAVDLGFRGTFLGGDGWDDVSTFVNLLKDNETIHAYAATHWHKGVKNKQSEEFVKNYYALYKEYPLTQAAIGYDTANLLFAALKLSGNYTSDGLKDTMLTMPAFPGITGNIEYHGNNEPKKDVVMMVFKPGSFDYHSTLRCEVSPPRCSFKK